VDVTDRIFCPHSGDTIRGDLEFDGEEFFGPDAHLCGAGGWDGGFDVEFEREDGAAWPEVVQQLQQFLRGAGYPPGTYIELFPPEWREGADVPDFPVFED
jgi:hypothetical protein